MSPRFCENRTGDEGKRRDEGEYREKVAAEGHVWGERGRDTYLHDAVELFWIEETTRERGENGANMLDVVGGGGGHRRRGAAALRCVPRPG